MTVSRITAKGQVTLPAELRRRAGIEAGDSVAFVMSKRGILIKRLAIGNSSDPQDWIDRVDRARSEVARGKTARHASDESFLRHLTANRKPK